MKMLPVFAEVRGESSERFAQVSLYDRLDRLDPELRGLLSVYLLESTPLIATGNVPDPLDESRGNVVPFGMATDGEWVWPLCWGYFVREYGVEVPEEFLEHVRAAHFRPVQLSDDDADRAVDEFEQLCL
ncbi:hypothetical protein [Streptomyces sp. URMC 129]|uniref:hypothetical protein n=1 Tax=Streptomyces sp. URMC 129 TaxID=3423407 RepID=UPI003F1B37AB